MEYPFYFLQYSFYENLRLIVVIEFIKESVIDTIADSKISITEKYLIIIDVFILGLLYK